MIRSLKLRAAIGSSLWNAFVLSGMALPGLFASTDTAIAKDDPSVVRSQSETDEETEVDEDDVEQAPDRFRRASNRRQAADSKPVRTPASSSDGPGIIGQAGHLAFKTFGRNQSITPIEAMPYILTDEHFFFADVRGFVSNSSLFGGNVGLGYRNLREDLNAWYGASIWYDTDSTTGKNFQQIGLSFEGLMDRWELRSNVYLPVTSSQNYSTTLGNEQIVGHQLLYTRYISQGTALQGVDVEAGYNLPIQELHRLRGFVGYYHFDGGPSGGINGFKTRLEGVINNSVTAQVMYTNDPLFGSNVMVGCSIQFPWGGSHPSSKWKQNTPSPFRFVERNYNVIVDRTPQIDTNLVAMNPLTHTAYNIEQVSTSAAPGGDGTFASPFQTVADAQAAGADVILVQGNSVLTTGVTLTDGQQLLGDGSFQPLALDGGGIVHLPTQVLGGATPQFNNVAGSAVTMGSNSVFAGFNVNNNNGNAVVGAAINGATVRDINFQNTIGDAVRFTNSTGTFDLRNLTINSATGAGISFLGGAPDLTLSGSISGTGNDGILLSNLTGGSVNIGPTSITSAGGAGLHMNNVAADVSIDTLTTSLTSGSGVAISGGTSANTYHFINKTTINQPVSTGFSVANSAAAVIADNLVADSTAASPAVSLTSDTGKITLSHLNLNTTNAVGLYGRNLTNLLVSGGTITTVNAGAIDVQNSTINMTLGSVSTDGGPFGIRLVQNTGAFNLTGSGLLGSGGTIQNTATGVILDTTGTSTISMLNLTDNGIGIQSTANNQVSFYGLQISGSTGYALDSLNDLVMMLRNSSLVNNGAIGAGTIRAQVSTAGNYQWLVDSSTITDHNGTPILFQTMAAGNGASLATTIHLNTINADRAGSPLINVNWNGPLSIAVANNALNVGADNMTAVQINDQSATDSIIARINNNAMTFTGTGGTGLFLTAAAGSTLQVDDNNIDFKGVNGTGLRFNLGGISSTWIYSNSITDEAGGATGMLFDAVAASSRMQIEANTINLLSTDLTVHRGIIFTSVIPTIQFAGNYNNIINNASTTFSIPVNSSTGQIIINGAYAP
ncbi:MAG: inverse autotransporter beta domain-containing protein [Planctomycetes bacterium]|nr:inverse autotransporter beta domain-containing protein [Planctomycetota bacterium]